MRLLGALLLALLGAVATPAAAAACDAFIPTFDQVIDNHEAIILGRVTAVDPTPGIHWNTVTIKVQRVLAGEADKTLVVSQPAYLCGDGLEQSDVGRRVLIATDVNFGFTEVAPYWWMRRGELEGWAETPEGVSNLEELANLIAGLPDTATDTVIDGDDRAATPWLPAIVGLLALMLFVARPIARRPAG